MIKSLKYLIILGLLLMTRIYVSSQNLTIILNDSGEPNSILQSQNYSDSLDLHRKLLNFQQKDIANGYFSSGYDSVIRTAELTTAYYSRGEKLFIRSLIISDSTDILAESGAKYKMNKSYNSDDFTNYMTTILLYFTKKGYPFAGIKPLRVTIENDSVDAEYYIDTGQYYVFDSIIIKGDAKIKPYYINKVSGLKKGASFSFDDIKSADLQLKTVPFFEQIRSYQLAFGNGKSDLIVYLRDKKAGSFSGILGIAPDNKTTGKLMLTGDLNLNLVNAAGAGEIFLVKWQKFDLRSQKLETEFSIPYLFKSDFGTGVDFDLEKRDTSFINTDFTAKILYGNNTLNGIDVFYRRRNSYLIGTSGSGFTDFSSDLYGLGFRYFATDDWLYPGKGIILKVNSAFGTRTTVTAENEKKVRFQTRNSVDFSAFIPAGRFMVLKIRSNTSSLYSAELSENETDMIGGLNSIRGFDELSLPATSYSVLNLELRYRFEERSALFAFYDAAYFEKRNTLSEYYNFAMGVGAGLDLNTAAGIFSLVFAAGKQNDDTFLFNNIKIHFGYRNVF
jgi:outer membrane translocation and assembly module TamA